MVDLGEAVTQAIKDRAELRGLALRRDVNDMQKRLQRGPDQAAGQPDRRPTRTPASAARSAQPRIPSPPRRRSPLDRLNQLSALAGLAPLSPAGFGSLPDILIGGYGTALSNVFSGRYQSVQVGLQFDLNLRNRTAEANLAQSVIAERRLKLEQARAEQTIEAQVRNALQAIETARQRIAAAEAGERAAQEKLDSETRLFQTGESTNFLVLDAPERVPGLAPPRGGGAPGPQQSRLATGAGAGLDAAQPQHQPEVVPLPDGRGSETILSRARKQAVGDVATGSGAWARRVPA